MYEMLTTANWTRLNLGCSWLGVVFWGFFFLFIASLAKRDTRLKDSYFTTTTQLTEHRHRIITCSLWCLYASASSVVIGSVIAKPLLQPILNCYILNFNQISNHKTTVSSYENAFQNAVHKMLTSVFQETLVTLTWNIAGIISGV